MTLDIAAPTVPRLHLIGLGQVGRAFLRGLDPHEARLIGVSDRSGSAFARAGLDANLLAARKHEGLSVASLSDAAPDLSLDLFTELAGADVVIDAATSALHDRTRAVSRAEAALRGGSRVVFASKDALVSNSRDWRAEIERGAIGWNAALGGTGARLASELALLAEETVSIALVANASTGALIEAAERGVHLDAAIVAARGRGVLESDPSLDLDGTDAAAKLAIVANALFGSALRPESIEREDLRRIPLDRLLRRAGRGATVRLVARAERGGRAAVAYELLPRSSVLAAPSDRVVYTYLLRSGEQRVHIGRGLGAVRVAGALRVDVFGGQTGGAS
jgi:homoserine dehydrogenase